MRGRCAIRQRRNKCRRGESGETEAWALAWSCLLLIRVVSPSHWCLDEYLWKHSPSLVSAGCSSPGRQPLLPHISPLNLVLREPKIKSMHKNLYKPYVYQRASQPARGPWPLRIILQVAGKVDMHSVCWYPNKCWGIPRIYVLTWHNTDIRSRQAWHISRAANLSPISTIVLGLCLCSVRLFPVQKKKRVFVCILSDHKACIHQKTKTKTKDLSSSYISIISIVQVCPRYFPRHVAFCF